MVAEDRRDLEEEEEDEEEEEEKEVEEEDCLLREETLRTKRDSDMSEVKNKPIT